MDNETLCYSLALAFVCGLGTGAIGMDVAYERQKQRQADMPRKLVHDIRPAVNLIPCDRAGREEHDRVCRWRKRSEATK
jgi:hypothetical protein